MRQLSVQGVKQKEQSAKISGVAIAKLRQQYTKHEHPVQSHKGKTNFGIVQKKDEAKSLLMEGEVNEPRTQKEREDYQVVESNKQGDEKVGTPFPSDRYLYTWL